MFTFTSASILVPTEIIFFCGTDGFEYAKVLDMPSLDRGKDTSGMRHQSACAWVSLIGFGVGAIIALTGCLGAHLGFWDYRQGLRILTPALAVGAAALVVGAIWLVRALAANDGTAARVGLVGLTGTVLLVGIPAHYVLREWTKPPIHDVSTDIGDAPAFVATLALRKGAESPPGYDGPTVIRFAGERMTTALAQKYAYPDIKPVERLAGTVAQKEFVAKYFWRSLNAVNALGWQVAGYDLKDGRIEATDDSFWFGVTTDIVVRVRPAGAIGVRVDIRAKSRVRGPDHGRNAELIRKFISKIKDG
jgi:hypothetical protein